MSIKIAVLPGDGIGPEVTEQAVRVLTAAADVHGLTVDFVKCRIGGAAIDATGEPLPADTLAACRSAHAVLLGAVGGPKWDHLPTQQRPEAGLLALRQKLGLFANLRPIKPLASVAQRTSPLKIEVVRDVDLLIVRELTGGIYFGSKTRTDHEATDVCHYKCDEIERIVRLAARFASGRRGKLTSIDKANVLETSRLWRSVVERTIAAESPRIQLEHMLVDSAAMQLLTQPSSFDVIVTENMFGDILSDEASVLVGSIGMLPSASLGTTMTDRGTFGLYEPVHGSAPGLAGMGSANPYGAILSVAMLLRLSLGCDAPATLVESSVELALADGASRAISAEMLQLPMQACTSQS